MTSLINAIRHVKGTLVINFAHNGTLVYNMGVGKFLPTKRTKVALCERIVRAQGVLKVCQIGRLLIEHVHYQSKRIEHLYEVYISCCIFCNKRMVAAIPF